MGDDLEETFQRFRKNRADLEELLNEVKQVYGDVSKLKSSQKLDLKELLLSNAEEDQVRQIFQDPKLVFTGQTNAGKSSLINEILGATVLKAEDVPCTSRIAELAYGPHKKPIITIKRKDGSVLETKLLTTSYIPTGIVNLSEEQRTDPELIHTTVHAEIDNDFLRGGVKIVDSPGRNENKELDRLVEDHMGSVLPIVVYVIDGRSMLSAQDIEDIECLYRNVPTGNVFFVVTKCDDPGFMEDDDTDDDDDSDSEDQTDVDRRLRPTRMEIDIREGVYRKLVEKKFLEDVPIDKCMYYHTLSSRYVKKYRIALKKDSQQHETMKTLLECERFMINFENFKVSLLKFTRQQLMQTVIDATDIIRFSLVKYLDYFVSDFNKAEGQSISNEQNIAALNKKQEITKLIGAEEIILWTEITSEVQRAKRAYIVAADKVVKNREKEIIDLAAVVKLDEFKIPSDGYVHSDVLNQRAADLAEKVMMKVGSMIHAEVMRENQTISNLFEDISRLVESLQARLEGKIKENDALRLVLTMQFKFDTKRAIIQQSFWSRAFNWFKSVGKAVVSFFVGKKVKYDKKTWHVTVVKKQLEVIDTEKLAEAVIDGILEHLQKAHDGFGKQLKVLQEFTKERLEAFQKASQENNQELESVVELRRTTPRIGKLLLMAWAIQDRGRVRRGKVLGGGSRGLVYECDAKGPRGEVCAVKVITLEDMELAGEIGLRLHCYWKIRSEYLAEIFGVQFERIGENVYELSIFMPRLVCNLQHALPGMKSLMERLLIARQVSEALVCIHREHMTHGSLSCTNVLLNADNRVRLTNYIEPVQSLPIHIAPELSRQQRTAKADVYSFGVLLWCLCGGEKMSDEPRDKTGSERRLERTPGMRNDCWALISKCLSPEPNERPTMEGVNRDLAAIMKLVG